MNFPIGTGPPSWPSAGAALLHLYIGRGNFDSVSSNIEISIKKPTPLVWNADFFWGEEGENRSGEARPQDGEYTSELRAAIAGLKALRRPCAVEMYTTSAAFATKAAKWLPGLRTSAWKKYLNKWELEARPLWDELSTLACLHDIQVYAPPVSSEDYEFVARIPPDCSGTFYAWCGAPPPWDASLGDFRQLQADDGNDCFDILDDEAVTTPSRLQAIEEAAKKASTRAPV